MKLEINTHFEVIETGARHIITGFDVYIGGGLVKAPTVVVKYRPYPIQPGDEETVLLQSLDSAYRRDDIRVFLTPEQVA